MKQTTQPWIDYANAEWEITKPSEFEKRISNFHAFCTMIKTIIDGNTRWSFNDVMRNGLASSVVINKLGDLSWTIAEMIQIKSRLFYDAHKKSKRPLPSGFLEIHSKINNDNFLSLSPEDVDTFDYRLSKFTFNRFKLIGGHHA